MIAQRSSQHAEARQEIYVIPQLGILGERKQPLHRAFEHDDQGGHQSRQEQRVVAMEKAQGFTVPFCNPPAG